MKHTKTIGGTCELYATQPSHRKHNVLNHYHNSTYISFRFEHIHWNSVCCCFFLLSSYSFFFCVFARNALTLILSLISCINCGCCCYCGCSLPWNHLASKCYCMFAKKKPFKIRIFSFAKKIVPQLSCIWTTEKYEMKKKNNIVLLKIRRCVILNLFHNLVFNCQFGFFMHILYYFFD